MRKLIILIFLGFVLLLNAEFIEKTYYFENPEIIEQDGFDLLLLDETQLSAENGEPVLPYREIMLLLPQGKIAASIELNLSEEVDLGSHYQLYPKQPSRPLSKGKSGNLIINQSLYLTDSVYPQAGHGNLTTQFLHGHAIALCTITPVKYFPLSGDLSFYRRVTARIQLQDDPDFFKRFNPRTSERVISKLSNFVQNPELLPATQTVSRDDDYQVLIITGSQFQNSFQALIDISMQRGLQSELIDVNSIYTSVTGQDEQEKIRNYIIQQYQDFNIQHVLLGGDVEIVPYRGFYCYVQSGSGYESYDIPADLYYAALDGTWDDNNNGVWGEIGEEDLLPELAVARLPFSTQSELNKMLNKILMYQTQPVLGELTNPLLAGENLYNNPLTWGGDYLDLLIGYQNENGYETTGIPLDDDYLTMYDRDLGTWSAADLISEINLGHPFIYHSGHSSYNYCMRLSDWQITNTNFSLVNGIEHNFTLIYSHGCNAGGFDQSDCIAEEMLKIDNFAAAYVGSSRYGWFNEGQTEGPSAHLNREFVDALYNDRINLIGQTNQDSKIETAPWVTAPGQWEEGALRWTFYGTNVLSDAVLPIWTAEPINITVNYDPAIILGETSFAVQISSPYSNVEDLSCTLIQNNELIGTSLTDTGGFALIEFESDSIIPGEILLFTSGNNCLLSEYTIQVITNGAYVQVSDYTVISGNDNVLEFGENALLSITLTEIGNTGGVNDLEVEISCLDDYITINDDHEFVGYLAAGSSILLADAFDFDISNDVPDEHDFVIELEITSNEGIWQAELDFTAYAADIHLENVFIDDDDNGILDPGETAVLQMELVNEGGADAYNLDFLLQTTNQYVSIEMLPYQIDSLNANGSGTFDICSITLDESAPLGEIIQFDLEITADNGYYTENDFELITGLILENFETGDFSMLDWSFDGSAEWQIDTEAAEGLFAARSGDISHNSYSTIQIEMEVIESGNISFWKKVSSEENYDYLRFYINGNLIDQWSGDVDWSEESFDVEPGIHTFSWKYQKDQAVIGGADCAWIDYIIFPPANLNTSAQNHDLPVTTKLLGNYPNPFNPSTTIMFQLNIENAKNTELAIYNLKGQKVKTLPVTPSPSHTVSVIWNGADDNGRPVSSGVYFYRLKSGDFVQTRRMLLLK